MSEQTCPVCLLPARVMDRPGGYDQKTVACDRCGDFFITGTADVTFRQRAEHSVDSGEPRLGPQGSSRRLNASGWVRENRPEILRHPDLVMLSGLEPIPVGDILDRLSQALASASRTVGEELDLNLPEWRARARASSRREVTSIARALEDLGLVEIGEQTIGETGCVPVAVTGTGWRKAQRRARDEQEEPGDIWRTVESMITQGESASVEFKSTLRLNLRTNEFDTRMEMEVLRAVAAFLNTRGGTVLVGVDDSGTPIGIDGDGFSSEDQMQNHLMSLVRDRIGRSACAEIDPIFESYRGKRMLAARCHRSPEPVHVTDGKIQRFYIRSGGSTTELSPSDTVSYALTRFR